MPSAMGLSKRNYLHNSSLRFNPMHISLLWRTYSFYWTLIKKRQTQISGMRLKKDWHELVFRIQSSIYDGTFSRKWLSAKNFIVDIRPGSKYPSGKRNKLFSFKVKTTLKDTTRFACALQNYYSRKIRAARFVTPWLYTNGTPPLRFS